MTTKFLVKLLIVLILNEIGEMSPTKPLDTCPGKHQMPLDEGRIKYKKYPYEDILFKEFGVLPEATMLETNGGTLVIRINFTDRIPTISMGPFGLSTYRFGFIYFHWLTKSRPEYDYENIMLPAELHILFYNEQYYDMYQAMAKENGTVILAYGLKVVPNNADSFSPIAEYLSKVRQEFTKTILPFASQLSLFSYTSKDIHNFYTYRGSATYYYCQVDVIWLDFIDPIPVTATFVDEIEQLYSNDEKPLMTKVRPSEPPKGIVYRSSNPDEADNGEASNTGLVVTSNNIAIVSGNICIVSLFVLMIIEL